MARKLLLKKTKKQLAIAVFIFSFLVMALLFFTVFSNKPGKQTAVVLDVGFAVCTADVPSSSCGSTEVKVKFKDSTEKILYVPGFDNRNPDPIDMKNKGALRKAQALGQQIEITFDGDIIKSVD